MAEKMKKRIIVGATGASGLPLLVKCLEIIRENPDFEFSGQSRTCYPLVEPTGLLGHLLRGQKPLKY